jgi:cytochrome c oxidase assembly factor CtaG
MAVMVVFDPAGIALVALMLTLYGRAVTVLRWRGYRVPRGQQALWYSGVFLIAVALLGPPDALSDDLRSAHMAQHLLLADIAAPLLLAGVFLGMAFILMRVQAYPWYGDRAHLHGLGVITDQQVGALELATVGSR